MTQSLRDLAIYFLGVLSVTACAQVTYRYYGLNIPEECYDKGTLIGKEGSDGWADLPFLACKPDGAVKGKCWVELSGDHFKKDNDLDTCHQALKDCQSGLPPAAALELLKYSDINVIQRQATVSSP